MDDAKFIRIFGDHRPRAASPDRLRFRDARFVADLKARFSGLAALDNRTRGSGWLVDFSPSRTDDLTERTMFDATLTSAVHGTRRMSFAIASDWVQLGDGAMQSAVRHDSRDLDRALDRAYRGVVLGGPRDAVVDPEASAAVSL